MPTSLRPRDWSIAGTLDADGRLDVEAGGRLEYARDGDGDGAPQGFLAFALDPFLAVDDLDVPGRRVRVERAWDRLRLDLEPPLVPGDAVDLRLRLRGRPGQPDFHLHGWRQNDSFALRFEGLLARGYPSRRSDLALSRRAPAASRRRVDLQGVHLSPVPRYAPWRLTPPPEAQGDPGLEVPDETFFPAAELALDLRVPAGVFLADSCGHTTTVEGGAGHLRGTCRRAVGELRLRGGALRPVATEGRMVVATLPGHGRHVGHHVEALATVMRLADRAWPGADGLDRVAALEWPPPLDFRDLRAGMGGWFVEPLEVHGRLVTIPEARMISRDALEPEDLVRLLLAGQLMARRALDPEQSLVWRAFFGGLMLRRMGLDAGTGATVSGQPWDLERLGAPVLEAHRYDLLVWNRKVPALVADLEGRVGRERLMTAIEGFLADAAAGDDVRALLAAVTATSGVELERFYRDFFVDGALPILALVDVGLERVDGRWHVRGRLRNRGGGRVVCPLVLETEGRTHRRSVAVDGDGDAGGVRGAPFHFVADERPVSVVLDPDRRCHRLRTPGSAKQERIPLVG